MGATYVCLDCGWEADYDAMCLHVRTVHSREPLSGPTVAVGDTIMHSGVKCRVLELLENGNMMVQPIEPRPLITLNMEYRVDTQSGKPIEQPSTRR